MAKRPNENVPDVPVTPKFIQVHAASGENGKLVVALDDEMTVWQWKPVPVDAEQNHGKTHKMRWVKLENEP